MSTKELFFVASERGQVFVAKQRYEAIGSRSNRVLSFDRGEELEVLNASGGSEWWEVRPSSLPHHCTWVHWLTFVSLRLSHYALETEGKSLPVSLQER